MSARKPPSPTTRKPTAPIFPFSPPPGTQQQQKGLPPNYKATARKYVQNKKLPFPPSPNFYYFLLLLNFLVKRADHLYISPPSGSEIGIIIKKKIKINR